MNFKQIIHPEILLDLRGPEIKRKVFKKIMGYTYFNEDETKVLFKPEMGIDYFSETDQVAFATMKRFVIKSPRKIFHVGRDFLEALQRVERGICLDYLPKNFCAYFSFPKDIVSDENMPVEGAYIFINPGPYGMHISICYIIDSPDHGWGIQHGPCPPGVTAEDWIKASEEFSMASMPGLVTSHSLRLQADIRKRANLINLIINCAMYVQSREPNVKRVVSHVGLSERQKKLQERSAILNECTLPVIFLNWNYAKQRFYSKDKTFVDTHLRWQPCGPGLSQVKLIWVKEHERHYKNALASQLDTHQNNDQ